MSTESSKAENKTGTAVVKKDSAGKSAEKKEEPKSKTKKETPTVKPKNPVSKIAVIALLLSLGVAALAGYEFYLLQNQGSQLNDHEGKNNELIKSLTQQNNLIQNLDKNIQATRQALSTESKSLNNSLNTISEKLGRTTDAWRLAEVEYLLTVANHRLNFIHDRKTAITIFEAADQRLLAMGDPGLLSVRKDIADELNQLRGISEPDLTGMALSLSSLSNEVENMPLVFKERVELATGQKQKAKPESWRQIPAAMWEEIKALVVIRRHQQPTEPLLPPAESWFLHQNLRLKLEQAQLALMRRETKFFREKLQQAQKWIEIFFDNDSATVKNSLKTLDELSKVELSLNIPDVSGSLRELRRLQVQRGVALNNKNKQ